MEKLRRSRQKRIPEDLKVPFVELATLYSIEIVKEVPSPLQSLLPSSDSVKRISGFSALAACTDYC
jgi:hypothetical protein